MSSGSILATRNLEHQMALACIYPGKYVPCLFLRPNSHLVLFSRTWISILCLLTLLLTFLLPLLSLNSWQEPCQQASLTFRLFPVSNLAGVSFQKWALLLPVDLKFFQLHNLLRNQQLGLRPIAPQMVHIGPYSLPHPLVLKSRSEFRRGPVSPEQLCPESPFACQEPPRGPLCLSQTVLLPSHRK